MAGNSTGSGSNGPIPPGQPQPTAAQTNAAYGQYGLHHYRGNVQNLNQVNSATSQSDKAHYGPFGGPIWHLINGHNEVDDKLSAAAKNLRQGMDLRTAPPAANVVYQSIPHQTLYDSVTQGVNPGDVGSISDTWLGIGNKMTNLQNTVAQAIASSQVSWTGKNAESARSSIAKLGNQSGAAGQSAQLAGVLIAQQSEALSTAKNSVPPPPNPAFNAQSAQQQLQTITDPVQFAAQAATDQAQALAQQESHKMAAQVVQNYDHTIAQTSASMPAFAPAPKVVKNPNPPSSSNPTANPPIGSGPPGSGPIMPRNPGGGGPVHVPSGPNGPGGGNPNGPGGFTPPNLPGGNQTTTTSGFTPPSMTGPNGPGAGGFPGIGQGTGFGSGPDGGFGGGGPGGMGGFGVGGLGAGGFGGSGSGGGFGSGGSGSSGSGGLGSGGGASGASGSGAGARSGAAGAAAAAEEAEMAEGRMGAPGSAGAGGMGGMGAGRGQRGQGDGEHKRPSWLVENDEGIFGTDELTAPPVIGE